MGNIMRQKPHTSHGEHKLHSSIILGLLFLVFSVIAVGNIYCYKLPNIAPETLDTTQWEAAPPSWPVGYAVLTAEQVQYTTDTEQIVCTWANFGSEPISYGEPFTLQKKVDGQWFVAQRSDGIVLRFLLPAYLLGSNESKTHRYDVAFMLDELTPGEYRIATDYSVDGIVVTPDSNHYQAYANFIIA